jgi:hypothetical protein
LTCVITLSLSLQKEEIKWRTCYLVWLAFIRGFLLDKHDGILNRTQEVTQVIKNYLTWLATPSQERDKV